MYIESIGLQEYTRINKQL